MPGRRTPAGRTRRALPLPVSCPYPPMRLPPGQDGEAPAGAGARPASQEGPGRNRALGRSVRRMEIRSALPANDRGLVEGLRGDPDDPGLRAVAHVLRVVPAPGGGPSGPAAGRADPVSPVVPGVPAVAGAGAGADEHREKGVVQVGPNRLVQPLDHVAVLLPGLVGQLHGTEPDHRVRLLPPILQPHFLRDLDEGPVVVPVLTGRVLLTPDGSERVRALVEHGLDGQLRAARQTLPGHEDLRSLPGPI